MANYTICQLEFIGNKALKIGSPKCLNKQSYNLNSILGVPAEKAVGFFVPNRRCEVFAKINLCRIYLFIYFGIAICSTYCFTNSQRRVFPCTP